MDADLSLFRWVTYLVGSLFSNADFTWVEAFIKESIDQELDFAREGRQSDRMGACLERARPPHGAPQPKRGGFMLADLPRVRTPVVYRKLSTKNVLTMEFIRGCRATDHGALKAMGASELAVSLALLEAFAECIFLHGYVHGDLHPGNLVVAPIPGGGVEVVLIDHGLHVALGRDFRRSYARLWNALAEADEAALEAAASDLGVVGDDYKALPWLLSYMPYANWKARSAPTRADVARMRRTGELDAVGDAAFYNRMPYVLVVMLRTNMQVAAILFENKGWAISLFQVMSTHARLALKLLDDPALADDADAGGCPHAWIAAHKPAAERAVAASVKYEK